LVQTDVPLFQLPEARDLHDEDVSSFGAQQQQLPRGVSQHGGHSGHTGRGTEEEEEERGVRSLRGMKDSLHKAR